MVCEVCGTEFFEGIFCPECGTRFQASDKSEQGTNTMEPDCFLNEEGAQETVFPQKETDSQELKGVKEKTEQERISKEKAEHEAIIMQQKKEATRLEMERSKREKDEQSRTFNGIQYDSIGDMENAKRVYKIKEFLSEGKNRTNIMAISGFILSLLLFPLIAGSSLWGFPAMAASFTLNIISLINKTEKKPFAIAGIVICGINLILVVLSLL